MADATKDNNMPTLPDSKILEIIQKIESTDDVTLVSSHVECGTVKGENYSGILLACNATAKVNKGGKEGTKDYHWMVKLPTQEAHRRASNRMMRIEEKEVLMYTEIIPKWRSMVEDTDLELNMCPVHHAEFDDKGSMLVMENMAMSGYKDPADKKKGLSLHNAKLVLAELGKFHALGYAYMKRHPGGIPEGLEKNPVLARDFFLGNPEEIIKGLFASTQTETMAGWNDILEAVQEPGQDFAGAFKRFHENQKNVFDYRSQLYRADESEFNTLCHGDCWFNNALFKEDGSGCCLIDLAMPRWGNPCTDLAYFFFLSVRPQLRRTHLEEMLGHYHDQLVRSLHALGEDPTVYPFRSLLKDYNKYSFVGFIMAMWFLPMMLCSKEDAIGQEEMGGDFNDEAQVKAFMEKMQEAMKNVMRKEPQVKIVMAGNFLEMVDRGVFKM